MITVMFLSIMLLVPNPVWRRAMILLLAFKFINIMVGLIPTRTWQFWGYFWSVKIYSTPCSRSTAVVCAIIVTATITDIIPLITVTTLIVSTIAVIFTTSTSGILVLSGGWFMSVIIPWPTTRWGYVKFKFEHLYPCRLLGGTFTLHCGETAYNFLNWW